MTRTHLPKESAQEDLTKDTAEQSNGAPDKASDKDEHSGILHRWMMAFCLVAMGGAMLFVLLRGNSYGAGAWLLVVPMLLCLGMHFLMHRHGHRHDND